MKSPGGWIKVPDDFVAILSRRDGASYTDVGRFLHVLLTMTGSDLRGYVPEYFDSQSEGMDRLCDLGLLARVEHPRPGYVLINEESCEAFNGTEYPPPIPADVREQLYQTRSTCGKCGVTLVGSGWVSPYAVKPPLGSPSNEGTIDHIIPVSRGGTNDVDNLRLLCRSCNSKKGARL